MFESFFGASCMSICISINYDKSIVCSYVQPIQISSRRSIRILIREFQVHHVCDEHRKAKRLGRSDQAH